MKATEICDVFRACFLASHNTWLKGGADEPVYLPAKNQDGLNYIYFRQDFAASALHEVSHWCIAGSIRRRQEDFGYWYDQGILQPDKIVNAIIAIDKNTQGLDQHDVNPPLAHVAVAA